MTQYDDKSRIRSAGADDAEFRRQCLEGTDRYIQALIAAGYAVGGYLSAARRAA
jgi:hypothetical protein